MLRGRTTVAALERLSVATVAAWIAACSSGIDGYYLETHSHGGTSDGASANGGDGGGPANGGSTSNGGDGAAPSGGDGAAPGGGDSGGTGGRGGDGGKADKNTGGATLITTGGGAGVGGGQAGVAGGMGGMGAGGAGTGGTSSGGTGAGGASTGGKGGTGGVGTGGVGTGGVGTGGATGGTGGVTATGPGDPQLVTLDNTGLGGITAAAWDGTHFYLLEPATRQFWEVDPAASKVTGGPFALPSGTVAPEAFGASPQWIYAIVGSSVYRLPHTGYTNQTGVTISLPTSASAAYSGGYFLIGDTASTGKTAQALVESTGTLSASASKYGTIFAVAGDNSGNLGFVTYGTTPARHLVNRVSAGTFTANATPCIAGASGTTGSISVYGQTVAWVLGGASNLLLYFDDISPTGVCSDPTPQSLIFGTSSVGSTAVGLIDSNDALVVNDFFSGTGSLVIERRSGAPSAILPNVQFGGSTNPKSIIVGGAHYAAVVSGNKPAIIRF